MLEAFHISNLTLLQAWIPSKEFLFRFAGTDFTYPITEEQITAYSSRHPQRRFYLGYMEPGLPYAFGEIIPQDKDSVRLGRLLVGDPSLRGRGLGLRFVQELIEEARNTFGISTVELFVAADNVPAIRCYRKAGFKTLDHKSFLLPFDGKNYMIEKMRFEHETRNAKHETLNKSVK